MQLLASNPRGAVLLEAAEVRRRGADVLTWLRDMRPRQDEFRSVRQWIMRIQRRFDRALLEMFRESPRVSLYASGWMEALIPMHKAIEEELAHWESLEETTLFLDDLATAAAQYVEALVVVPSSASEAMEQPYLQISRFMELNPIYPGLAELLEDFEEWVGSVDDLEIVARVLSG